jgi:hypothetical protein
MVRIRWVGEYAWMRRHRRPALAQNRLHLAQRTGRKSGFESAMKITIEIDCTPQEARQLAGLPDIEPLQQEIMKQVRDRVVKAMSLSDPETLIKAWVPMTQTLGQQGIEAFQGIIKMAQSRTRGDKDKSK